jgi:hypothetical protein
VTTVLTNPPFVKNSSVTIVNEAGDEEKQSLVVHRDDFWAKHEQQTAQLSPARLHHPEAARPRRDRCA